MTWTNREHEDAVKKAGDGKSKLSDHEKRKLEEASRQAGGRGREADRALRDYDRRR